MENNNRQWDLQLSNLIIFCMRNKRFIRMGGKLEPEEKVLSDWLTTQIGDYKRGQMSKYRIDRLNAFSTEILNPSDDTYKTLTDQIRKTYTSAINPAMAHSELTGSQMLELKKLGITSDIEAVDSIAWATLTLSSFEDIKHTDKEKQLALNILKAVGIVGENNRILIRNKLARNLAARLDTTFDINSLYLVFAIMGPEGAWRAIFNGSKQEQLCARVREMVIKNCDIAELSVIATRYYKFKSLDDIAEIMQLPKEKVKEIENSAITKLSTAECKEYIINNMLTEKDGTKVDAGLITNFQIATTYGKIRSSIKE